MKTLPQYEAPTSWGPPEDTGRTLAVGLILFIGAVAAGAFSGVLARFAPEERLALTLFATIFTIAAYRLDAPLRDFVRSLPRLGVAAGVFDIAVLAGIATPHGEILIAAIPLAAAAHLALLDRGRVATASSPVRSTAAKSPGARPAAT
jgi:hypothetical protein